MKITEVPEPSPSKTADFEKKLGQAAALFLTLFSAWKFLIFASYESRLAWIIPVVFVGFPFAYMCALTHSKITVASVFLYLWAGCVLVFCYTMLDMILLDFAFFFKFIVPAAGLYWCMVVGIGGITREEGDGLFTKPSNIKYMGAVHHTDSPIFSFSIVVMGTAIFTLDVCIAKYIHDLFILSWNCPKDCWLLLFIGGLLAGYIPAHFVGCALGTLFEILSTHIYRRIKGNDNKESL